MENPGPITPDEHRANGDSTFLPLPPYTTQHGYEQGVKEATKQSVRGFGAAVIGLGVGGAMEIGHAGSMAISIYAFSFFDGMKAVRTWEDLWQSRH